MEPHKHIKSQKRRKGLWIALCILLILAAGVVGVGIWQKNNLEAVKQYTQYSQEELEQQLQDNDKQVQDILNAALETAKKVDSENAAVPEQQTPTETPSNTVEDPNAAVQEPAPPVTEPTQPAESVESAPAPDTQGTPNASDVPVAPPVSDTPQAEAPPTGSTQPVPSQPAAPKQETPQVPAVPETPADASSTYETELQVIVDKVYALREEYLRELDDLQAEAVAAYKAIPRSQRTKKAIINFVSTYITKATALEKQCDGKMDALVNELTQLQKKYGQTMELVDAVKYTYANEKSLKKAWYMSELEKRGMI